MHELDLVARFIPAGSRILEIGAGVGWQAKELQNRGFNVEAIDLADGTYAHLQIHHVQSYDGKTVPFPDDSFDVVFSSNVLEHIPQVEVFQSEIHRVLRPGGIAIHGLPTPTWRLWTSFMHYPHIALRLVSKFIRRPTDIGPGVQGAKFDGKYHSFLSRMCRALYAPRHGESGSVATELYYFSRRRWRNLFARTGWNIVDMISNRLLYSGYLLGGSLLPFFLRRWASKCIGGSVTFYVLRPVSRSKI